MKAEKTRTKAVILDAAEALFSEMGFDGTSTRIIAAKAGVNMSMLNYYFGSKDGLYKAVLERRLAMPAESPGLTDGAASAWDKLYDCIDFYAGQVLSDSKLQRLIYYELSLQQRYDISDFILENLTRAANEVKLRLSEGIESGSFRNVDIELTVTSIFGTIYYLINSEQIASRILSKNLRDPKTISDDIQPRLKKHLHDLLNALLKKHYTQE